MRIETTRFGPLDVDEKDLIRFPLGLVGMADLGDFVMFDGPEPFKWLQSTGRPELAYVLCDPALFSPEYRVRVPVEELAPVAVTAIEQAVVCIILSIPDDWRLMTANLAGPVVFNVEKRLGMQIVLSDPEYSVKHRVFGSAGGEGEAATGREQG